MKLFLLATLAIVATAHHGNELEHEHDYMYFPDGDGVPHLIDLQERVEDVDAIFARNVDTITFNLYTRNNPASAQILTLNSIATVTSSNFLSSRPTRIVTHGWRSSEFSDACVVVRDAYLAAGDYNVIVVDWSSIASENYLTAASSVRNVAGQISSFLNFLNENAGLQFGETNIVGHSLGGHIAGIAAQGASGNIQAVIALDPALPGFDNAGAGSGVHPSDADHVQVIHTNAGLLGLSRAAGDSDFYPNGGTTQPGCGLDLVGSCAHSRAYYFFAESIVNPTGFPATATRSGSLEAFTTKSTVYMGGEFLSTHASGSYTLTTGSSAPFALG
ncbi:pancreatic triacylglycerol lipase [Neodiprion lecontei]|uniref:phospholipase A1 n=1 Tax=Neodiprion lecontei TaxID=441921 RepID=A0A6J0BRP0_NEOLC|nr:pancreatic triacylglycerol lipase [Neodiprion lecontei]